MLAVVWNRLISLDSRDVIKKTLNTEILDAECTCFTCRISRLINCLVGYDDLVAIEIDDKEQIEVVIDIARKGLGENYAIMEHRTLELQERGYTQEVIDEWIKYIEE